MNTVAKYPIRACGGVAPSLVRIDKTYGNGSSDAWLYDVLQATLVFLGVGEDKFRKEQILDLAKTITSQYPAIKVSEILLFLARFKSGKYGRFYGDSSYALVIMESLDKFYNGECADYRRQAREQEEERKRKEDAKNAISFEEYRRRVGGKTNLDAMFGYVEEETKEQDNK